ncbi:unnamed protein product [Danaus chrysippus]|uniref:(African queen) hypothetical protein n=1 Tax=Danaus chrysippus TaxID=151541 RepID=A0A8J2R626_9NEOP|nr:unnamed protein product [Danaus chrysippus]
MTRKEFFILLTLCAIVLASDGEDNEQKKRGASKTSGLNAIPTGSQKPDYTYNLYSQTSGPSSPSQTYQPSSFYPNQAPSQYFTPSNNDLPASNPSNNQALNQQTHSQFVPINLTPNNGYQSKYQFVPQRLVGNVQLAIMQQPTLQPSILQYPHSFFSNPTNHLTPGLLGQGHLSFGPSFQTLPAGHIISQPSMIVLPQPHAPLYNNLVYPNPAQYLYNYNPALSQPKFGYSSFSPSTSNDAQSVSKGLVKDDSGTSQNSEYLSPDSNSYKHTFTSRSTYPKK